MTVRRRGIIYWLWCLKMSVIHLRECDTQICHSTRRIMCEMCEWVMVGRSKEYENETVTQTQMMILLIHDHDDDGAISMNQWMNAKSEMRMKRMNQRLGEWMGEWMDGWMGSGYNQSNKRKRRYYKHDALVCNEWWMIIVPLYSYVIYYGKYRAAAGSPRVLMTSLISFENALE